MKIECEQCHSRYTISDDKVQPGVEFSFTCPKCKNKNTFLPPGHSSAAPSAQTSSTGDDLDTPGSGVADFFEEGARPALLCFEPGPTRDQLKKIVEDLDFVPVFPESVRDAMLRIKLTQFYMILIHENFGGQTLESNNLLRLIQPMEMPIRRRIFVVLFGKNVKTMDQMTAYTLSVNLLVNLDDEHQFNKILQRGYAEYERFYKVFFDVMREIGKI